MLTLMSMLLLLCGEQEGERSGTCDPQTLDRGSDDDGAAAAAAGGGGGGGGESFEEKLTEIMDNVMHSKMMEELKALPSEVIEELKNFPSEIRESLLLHVERRSLVVAGVVVAVVAALLLLGCVWIHWCHTEHGEYRYIPISQVEEFLRYQTHSSPSSSASSSSSSPRHAVSSSSGHHSARRRKHSGRSSSSSSSSSHHRRRKDEGGEGGSRVTHRRTDHNHIANGGQ